MFYTLTKHEFLTNQSVCRILSICIKAIKQLNYISSTECILDFGWSRSCAYLAENLRGKHFMLWLHSLIPIFADVVTWPMFTML